MNEAELIANILLYKLPRLDADVAQRLSEAKATPLGELMTATDIPYYFWYGTERGAKTIFRCRQPGGGTMYHRSISEAQYGKAMSTPLKDQYKEAYHRAKVLGLTS